MLCIGMEKQVIYLEVSPMIKSRIRKIAEQERRTMTGLLLFLIDKKISEVENAKSN